MRSDISRILNIGIVVGTRPEAIKLSELVYLCSNVPNVSSYLISTGQQGSLLQRTLLELDMTPDLSMQSKDAPFELHEKLANLVQKLGEEFCERALDYVVVQGDTSSALAGALAAFQNRIQIAHVEAGLRSGDKNAPFPEEMYRRLITQLSDLHFPPTELARQNLIREMVPASNVFLVGNTIVDALIRRKQILNKRTKKQILVTLHRRENFGAPMVEICQGLRRFSEARSDFEIIAIRHPNPKSVEIFDRYLNGVKNIRMVDPMSYDAFLEEMAASCIVLTDSGGIQEECAVLQKPLLIARNTTERPEVLTENSSLVGTKMNEILEALTISSLNAWPSQKTNNLDLDIFGRGDASWKILNVLTERHRSSS